MSVEVANEARRKGCAGCNWWRPYGEAGMGSCRAGPPRTSSITHWPHTEREDYCACWVPRLRVLA